MINNDFSNSLRNFFNRGNKNEAQNSSDIVERLKARQQARAGKGAAPEEAAAAQDAAETSKKKPATSQDIIDSFTRSKGSGSKKGVSKPTTSSTAAKESKEDDSKLSAEERRQKELKEILEKIEKEESQKNANRNKTTTESNASASVTSEVQTPESGGVEGFLNELPLFSEFKTSLMDAFKSMDTGTSGSIKAQYELNYTTMQAIATAGGGYEYQETTVNVKFDLNYVKAAAGGTSGEDIAKALEGATDFASLMDALEKVGSDPAFGGSGTGAASGSSSHEDFISQLKEASKVDYSKLIPGLSSGNLSQSMQDYFGPEATAGRILDFATSFFPMSDAYKKGGDTEESREEFAEMMRKAVQKGFDQALGSLGSIPKETKDGIDKTHELVFKGFDDFVKNGANPAKNDTYKALQELSFNFESSVTTRNVSVSYGPRGGTQQPSQTSSALDAQA